jgi:DNA-binding MarR family transcriptional regulator
LPGIERKEAKEAVMNVIDETFKRIFGGISEKEIDQIKRFLKKVLNNVIKEQ